MIEYTRLGGQSAVMLGGRGGWYATPSLVLGAGLYGTATEVDAREADVPDAPGPLDLKVEKFGLELEYHVRAGSRTDFTIGTFVGGAAAHHVRDRTTEQHGETDFLFLVQPVAGIEQTLASWLRVHIGASFMIGGPVEQVGLRGSDVRGPGVALALKAGRF
ncbi:MAG: hypothetical protein AB7T31_00150 [Gemmatimonadales bacterium]